MEAKWTPFAGGKNTTPIFNDPASESGSNAIFGEGSVQQNDPKTDKRISVGWHWTYGYLRRPEMDEIFGYAYEDPDGDMVYIDDMAASKRVMMECREDARTGERYVCLHKDR